MAKRLERLGEVRIIDEPNGFGLDYIIIITIVYSSKNSNQRLFKDDNPFSNAGSQGPSVYKMDLKYDNERLRLNVLSNITLPATKVKFKIQFEQIFIGLLKDMAFHSMSNGAFPKA